MELSSSEEASVGDKFETISLTELSVLEITCKKCGTILALKMDGEGFFPESCPTCRELPNGLSGRLNKALNAYRNFYREMSGLDLEPRFRIRREEP
jgi:phage FluMu protein Com